MKGGEENMAGPIPAERRLSQHPETRPFTEVDTDFAKKIAERTGGDFRRDLEGKPSLIDYPGLGVTIYFGSRSNSIDSRVPTTSTLRIHKSGRYFDYPLDDTIVGGDDDYVTFVNPLEQTNPNLEDDKYAWFTISRDEGLDFYIRAKKQGNPVMPNPMTLGIIGAAEEAANRRRAER